MTTSNFRLRIYFVLALFFSSSSAFAQSTLTGLWYCNAISQGVSYPQDIDIVQNGASLSGYQYYSNTTNIFATVSGSVSGNSITMFFDYITSSYTVSLVGAVSGDTYSATWTSSAGQNGTISCNRAISTVRGSALSLFCNRKGVNLSTATCTATVGDVGPPPRSAPTGSVSFVADSGFLPATGSCNLSQTQFSPGVSSCEFTLQVPSGFPIGAAFPITISYSGDITFNTSSASHSLIQAGCVGTPENPCSGAVALGFADIPKVAKGILDSIVTCGGGTSAPRKASKSNNETPKCSVKIKATTSAGKLLSGIEDADVYKGLSAEILKQMGAKSFTDSEKAYGNAFYDLTSELANNERYHQSVFKNNKSLPEIEQELDSKLQSFLKEGSSRNLFLPATSQKSRKSTFSIGEVEAKVNSNKSRNVKLKVNRLFSALTASMKNVGITYAPMALQLESTREGKVPKGTKRKVKINQNISAVLVY